MKIIDEDDNKTITVTNQKVKPTFDPNKDISDWVLFFKKNLPKAEKIIYKKMKKNKKRLDFYV